ncbi:MAG: methyltransferase domain-containing protein [Alphaproteobacteria bacterium]|nr:methyltransferase domain-containing protein [Alphaproteobacteria bacterium]
MSRADPAQLMRFILEMRQAGITDPVALRALERTPRAHYAPAHLQALAYEDRDLPLPHGQAMTRPSLVGRMIMALAPAPEDSILEIGTGSGFQTAALAALARKVTTLDRIPDLVTDARAKFGEARVMNIAAHLGDGHDGWAANAPYDAIIVNADAQDIPAAFFTQLAPSGRIVLALRGRLVRARIGAREDLGEARFAELAHGLAPHAVQAAMSANDAPMEALRLSPTDPPDPE